MRSLLLIVLGVSAAGIAAVAGPPLLRAYQDDQARAAEAHYHQTASEQDGYQWADMWWPDNEAKCPPWNPAFTSGCVRRVRERMSEKRTDELRRQARAMTPEQLVAAIARRNSGDDAGYEWAADHDIQDEGDCDNDSSSFTDGCSRYVEEQAR